MIPLVLSLSCGGPPYSSSRVQGSGRGWEGLGKVNQLCLTTTHPHHAAAHAKNQVHRVLLQDVIVREGAAVLELLARKDQALLVGRDALLVLDLGLDVLDL